MSNRPTARGPLCVAPGGVTDVLARVMADEIDRARGPAMVARDGRPPPESAHDQAPSRRDVTGA
jgi:hypothetical protein